MTGTKLYSRVLRFLWDSESSLVTILADLINNQTDPTWAHMPKREVTFALVYKKKQLVKKRLIKHWTPWKIKS